LPARRSRRQELSRGLPETRCPMSDLPMSSDSIGQRVDVLEKQTRRLRRALLALAFVTILTFAAIGFGDRMLRVVGSMSVEKLELRDGSGNVHAILTATTQ